MVKILPSERTFPVSFSRASALVVSCGGSINSTDVASLPSQFSARLILLRADNSEKDIADFRFLRSLVPDLLSNATRRSDNESAHVNR